MSDYNLQNNLILHDKYEEIDKEIKKHGIDIASNPEYRIITLDKYIQINMNVMAGKIQYSWKITINDYLSQILMLFALLILVNNKIIANIIWLGKIEYTIVENISEVILSILFSILIIIIIFMIPKVINFRVQKMQEIEKIISKIIS
jgi:hypothetical protein